MNTPVSLPVVGAQYRWDQQVGLGQAISIVQASRAHTGWSVVVLSDPVASEHLKASIEYFLNDPTYPVLIFPDWETLPFDQLSPHQDLISERLETLCQLRFQRKGILIVSVATLMQRIAPTAFLDQNTFFLETGQLFDPFAFAARLQAFGYVDCSQVGTHGEFARRGHVFDVFPMGATYPIRIEVFEEEIESLRAFDPVTQLTVNKVSEMKLYPAREFPTHEDAIQHFRAQWRAAFSANPSQCPLYESVSAGFLPPGIEYFLPLFFEETGLLFDYLESDPLFLVEQACTESAQQFFELTQQRYDQYSHDLNHPILPVSRVFLSVPELFEKLGQCAQIRLYAAAQSQSVAPFTFAPLTPDLKNQFVAFTQNWQGSLYVFAESAGRMTVLSEWLDKQELKYEKKERFSLENLYAESGEIEKKIYLTIGPIEHGMQWLDKGIAIVTELDLLPERIEQVRARKTRLTHPDQAVRNLSELAIGQPVVHIEHGVGLYQGLIHLAEQNCEFMKLEYAAGDVLYVPILSLHLIHRYGSTEGSGVVLNRLGSGQWEKTKRQAAKQVEDMAAQLLDLYAKRRLQTQNQLAPPTEEFTQFCRDFPFELTRDQAHAVKAVIQDLTTAKPMDRLICGDVGFGKTEVALRASFISVASKKQVAILVPTTLLAMQHYETFMDRFGPYGYRVALLSRFKTAKEQRASLSALEAGTVEIVVGTHALLSSAVRFENLGLLIIDEEHRFGVKQKERLKKLRADVNLLTLTATPIPRTLNFGLSGLRDLSIITSPPAKRLSVKTFVKEYSQPLIMEGIERELRRGGQVFYLHNDVDTIAALAEKLSAWFPKARVGIAHGQMRERALERVMLDFYHKRYQILCCTTIIETGIDVQSANTMFIERADRFGLAQLHQLRGRVGRSHHQAYAFLLVPPIKVLGAKARKRLEAIAQYSELGSGYALATQDLEIRGAGEILGENQSGQMEKIGMGLYLNLLQKTVKKLQLAGDTSVNASTVSTTSIAMDLFEPTTSEFNCQVAALIPDDYIPDVHQRLILYKRITNAETQTALETLQSEMADRFGRLPESTQQLFQLADLQRRASLLGIRQLKANKSGGLLEFIEKPPIAPEVILRLMTDDPKEFSLKGSNTLRFVSDLQVETDRLAYIGQLFSRLGG